MSYEDGFYEEKSWGSVAIKESKDLPTLKFRYVMRLLHKGNKNAKVLEIGSGSGRILASIHEHEPKLKLRGLDISEEQVKLATSDNPDISFIVGNCEDLPFKDNNFDYVIFLDVIEHVHYPDKLLKEAARVLKPGGYLHGFIPCEGQGIYSISTKILGWHIKEKTIGHIQQFTITDILTRVRRARLKVTKTKYSYHLLCSIMDYTMFALLLNKKIAKMFWSKNKYYHNKRTRQTFASKVFNVILSITNAIAYYESDLFQDVSFLAAGIHITARKE